MRVRRLSALLGSAALVALGLSTPAAVASPGELAPGAHPAANVQASDRVVYHYDRGESAQRAAGRPGSSANMTYHSGPVLSSPTTTHAIFWGTSWGTPGDKITGMEAWYIGFGDSNYAKTTTEYTSGGPSGPHVSASTNYDGYDIDLSPASGGSNSSVILGEVAKVITTPVANAYYAVYTDLPRGHAKYCAWHSSGTIGSGAAATPVEFAFFWKLDNDPGCSPQDTSGLHSDGLAAIANVSGHELAEAMTDPASPGAWYDSAGYENGDKCAWTFGAPLVTFPKSGTQWKIQGEWSNAAYSGLVPDGYANSSGQKGCLSGK